MKKELGASSNYKALIGVFKKGLEEAFVEEMRQQGIVSFEDLLFALPDEKIRKLFELVCSNDFYELYLGNKYKDIKLKSHTDTWGAIADKDLNDLGYYLLLENEEYGDESCYLLARVIGDGEFEVIDETFDDIDTALEDAGII